MIQNERNLVRRPCIAYLRSQEATLRRVYPFVYWASPPDHGKVKPYIAKQMYLDGYTKGVFDLCLILANQKDVKVWLIEFKHGSNGYTKEQKQVSLNCEDTPVEALKIKSIDEFIEFIEEIRDSPVFPQG